MDFYMLKPMSRITIEKRVVIRGYMALDLLENRSEENAEPIGMFPIYSNPQIAMENHPDTEILPVEIFDYEVITH